jgi:Chaperone of endosialidase
MKTKNMKPLHLKKSICRSPLRLGSLIIPLVLVCFALLPGVQAVVPAPDGGYPGGNTAEGQNALFSLTTGGFNAAVGFLSLRSNTTGQFNTAIGAGTLLANTADQNTATGAGALLSNTTGSNNTVNGAFALFNNTEGDFNTANGVQALFNNTTGQGNTANGFEALINNTTGAVNIALGRNAGSNLTTGNFNIDIGNIGVADESNTVRIGAGQTRTFIAGIRGKTTGIADAVSVLIDSAGQLGTMSSSRRFKNEIKPMDKASDALLALKPVTFHYKSDSSGTPQFGLIAEEVAAVNPDLVVRDEKGEIYTVRYDAVNAMLLNEFLKEHRKVENLEATVAQQHKDFEAAVAELKGQIQKVSAQLETSKPAPQVVKNP